MLSCGCSLKELPEADKQMIWQRPCPMSSCGSGCLRAVLPPGQADSNAKVCLHDKGNEHCAVMHHYNGCKHQRYTTQVQVHHSLAMIHNLSQSNQESSMCHQLHVILACRGIDSTLVSVQPGACGQSNFMIQKAMPINTKRSKTTTAEKLG